MFMEHISTNINKHGFPTTISMNMKKTLFPKRLEMPTEAPVLQEPTSSNSPLNKMPTMPRQRFTFLKALTDFQTASRAKNMSK